MQQVRQETSKVTWPTRKETMISTGMVFVMVIIAALFFFFVDQILSGGVKLIFGLGS
jgi:preprotein translocase subunit SecE